MKNWSDKKVAQMLNDHDAFSREVKSYANYVNRVKTGKLNTPSIPLVNRIYSQGLIGQNISSQGEIAGRDGL